MMKSRTSDANAQGRNQRERLKLVRNESYGGIARRPSVSTITRPTREWRSDTPTRVVQNSWPNQWILAQNAGAPCLADVVRRGDVRMPVQLVSGLAEFLARWKLGP